jgi:hypothetical protein
MSKPLLLLGGSDARLIGEFAHLSEAPQPSVKDRRGLLHHSRRGKQKAGFDVATVSVLRYSGPKMMQDTEQ